jgi:hypothetical protein
MGFYGLGLDPESCRLLDLLLLDMQRMEWRIIWAWSDFS